MDLQFEQLTTFLSKFGDAEFNNPSGIYAVMFDLGLPLAAVYFCMVGFVGGMIYQSYRREYLTGVLFYPLFFIAFLEVFRFPYLGTSRAFTWLLGIVLVLLLRKASSRGALPDHLVGGRTQVDRPPVQIQKHRFAGDLSVDPFE